MICCCSDFLIAHFVILWTCVCFFIKEFSCDIGTEVYSLKLMQLSYLFVYIRVYTYHVSVPWHGWSSGD